MSASEQTSHARRGNDEEHDGQEDILKPRGLGSGRRADGGNSSREGNSFRELDARLGRVTNDFIGDLTFAQPGELLKTRCNGSHSTDSLDLAPLDELQRMQRVFARLSINLQNVEFVITKKTAGEMEGVK